MRRSTEAIYRGDLQRRSTEAIYRGDLHHCLVLIRYHWRGRQTSTDHSYESRRSISIVEFDIC